MSLFWVHWFPFGNIFHIVVVKLIYGAIGCGILYYTYRILRLKLNQPGAVLVMCILCFNSISFWDIPEPKADIICLFFLLLGTYFFLTKNRKKGSWGFILALLSTPKVILFLPLPIFMLASQREWNFKFTLPNFKQKLNILRAIIVISVLSAVVKLDLSPLNSLALINSYHQALRYGKDLFQAGIDSGFYTMINSYYPLDFVCFYLPIVILFFIFGFRNRWLSISKTNFMLFFILSVFIVAVVGVYPLKHPYFLIPILFFLTISIFYFFNLKSNIFEALFNSKLFAIVLVVHFGVNFYQIFKLTNMNQGISQYDLLLKLNRIANVNPEALIADGTGALPQANLVPQFFGLYDYAANHYATLRLQEQKPDVLFLTPKLQFADYRFMFFVNRAYISIAPGIVVKKVEVPSELLFSSTEVIKNLQSTFSFPIRVISFRSDELAESNNVVKVTCADTFDERDFWPTKDFESCSRFFFKYKPDSNVFAVPWPSYEKNWDVSLIKQLNYKNN